MHARSPRSFWVVVCAPGKFVRVWRSPYDLPLAIEANFVKESQGEEGDLSE
jgi:hypothetical protein